VELTRAHATLNCSLNHARSGPHSCSASTAPLVSSISPPPITLWLAMIFIVLHGPQAHVNSCGNRPVRRANLVNNLRRMSEVANLLSMSIQSRTGGLLTIFRGKWPVSYSCRGVEELRARRRAVSVFDGGTATRRRPADRARRRGRCRLQQHHRPTRSAAGVESRWAQAVSGVAPSQRAGHDLSGARESSAVGRRSRGRESRWRQLVDDRHPRSGPVGRHHQEPPASRFRAARVQRHRRLRVCEDHDRQRVRRVYSCRASSTIGRSASACCHSAKKS
jgi:hypothetical protein